MTILDFLFRNKDRDSKTDCRRIKNTIPQNMDVEPIPAHILAILEGELPCREPKPATDKS
jgi:hypothetical protein